MIQSRPLVEMVQVTFACGEVATVCRQFAEDYMQEIRFMTMRQFRNMNKPMVDTRDKAGGY